jgi:Na+/H+ antiporter NhaD/arsenite permease-like protein
MRRKFLLIVCVSLLAAFLGGKIGFSLHQSIVAAVFCMSILGVLFFWELRLSFVFFGAGILLLTRSVDLENLIRFASLDVILFLIGMMILVGMLNDAGVFYWIVTRIMRMRDLSGKRLFMLLMVISAVLSSLMGEVASIIIMAKIILDISDFIDIEPAPLILASVLATNIGSSATVLGNPIGILIAARANLTFEDFIKHALPITACVLIISIGILSLWFKKMIKKINEKLMPLKDNTFFLSLISIPTDKKTKISIGIFVMMLSCIVFHRRLEVLFQLEENTLLMILPIVFAGIALLYRRDRVRYYIEHEVEWMSILFFLFLFALAGVIKYSGISDIIAGGLVARFGKELSYFSGVMIYTSGLLSAVLDNTVVVAAYIPVIQSLGSLQMKLGPFWWAILFGACYGGNITLIGSTANIVAMDLLEKKGKTKVGFFEWLKIGAIVGIVSMTTAYLFILWMSR